GSAVTWSFGAITGTGAVNMGAVTLTLGNNFSWGLGSVVTTAGTSQIACSTHILTFASAVAFSASGGNKFNFSATGAGGMAGSATLTFTAPASVQMYTGSGTTF